MSDGAPGARPLRRTYDTDDVAYRLLTLLQMTGVLVFAVGVPPGSGR